VAFQSDVLTIEKEGSIATLWLDRSEARNAMGPEFWRDLPLAVAELDEDDEVRAIVLAANGPHFSVGLDLKAMGGALSSGGESTTSPATRNAKTYAMIRSMQDSVSSVAKCTKPVIAAIHGYCIGGGVDLIAACDVRFASSDAIFSVREAKVAIVADIGSLQRLPKIIGMGHVMELALSGKDITAIRAAEIGLVNQAEGDKNHVVHVAKDLAREIAANSPLAVQGTKAVLNATDGKTVQEGLEFVAAWNTLYMNSNDLTEAMMAFLEKRPPKFEGN
jgi:enoyl-CoA hydratase